ncbi:MAG: hypothetical protein ACE5IQ_04185 [Candidatus Methylomirabilales bacterium]
MVRESVAEITTKTNEALNETLNKAVEAFSLASDANRDLSGRTVDVSAAIAREGVQYLGNIQGAIRRASEEAQELWNRQWAVTQELPNDPGRIPQKAMSLYWEGGEKVARLVDAQVEALTRFTGTVQDLLDRAGRETRETATTYTEKILDLYNLKG